MNRLILAVIVGVFASASPSMADGPKDPPIGPEARARLDALIASYRAFPAYADHGEVTLVVKAGDRPLKQTQKASVAFARPNRLDVQTDLVRVVSDGSNVTSVVAPLKKFQTIPAPKKFAESSLRGGPLGAIEFGGLAGLPLVHVLNLVIGDEPERLIQDFTPSILVEADQVIEGTAYRVLRLDESDNHDWRFLIDPKTGLLALRQPGRRGGRNEILDRRGRHPRRVAPMDRRRRLDRGPAGAEAFAFQPLPGFTGVGEARRPRRRPSRRPDPLVGKPAPDFSLDVLDGPGKTRKVTKADLAGKVVLLDFWATWCGPCLVELPDVQELVESYARAEERRRRAGPEHRPDRAGRPQGGPRQGRGRPSRRRS